MVVVVKAVLRHGRCGMRLFFFSFPFFNSQRLIVGEGGGRGPAMGKPRTDVCNIRYARIQAKVIEVTEDQHGKEESLVARCVCVCISFLSIPDLCMILG